MLEKKIKLTEYEEVKEFVHAAEKCDFDIDVFYNRIIIDAKSMLGVLSLDLSRELTVNMAVKITLLKMCYVNTHVHKEEHMI